MKYVKQTDRQTQSPIPAITFYLHTSCKGHIQVFVKCLQEFHIGHVKC